MVNWNSLFSCQRQWPTFLSSSFKSSALHAWPLQAALMAFSHTMLLACPQALSVECNQLTSKYTQPAVDAISINVNIYIYHHISLYQHDFLPWGCTIFYQKIYISSIYMGMQHCTLFYIVLNQQDTDFSIYDSRDIHRFIKQTATAHLSPKRHRH